MIVITLGDDSKNSLPREIKKGTTIPGRPLAVTGGFEPPVPVSEYAGLASASGGSATSSFQPDNALTISFKQVNDASFTPLPYDQIQKRDNHSWSSLSGDGGIYA